MKTAFALLIQYEAPVIPAETVCTDFFAGMTYKTFLARVDSGELDLLVTRLGSSRKAPRVVHVNDLADYLDRWRDKAESEAKKLRSA